MSRSVECAVFADLRTPESVRYRRNVTMLPHVRSNIVVFEPVLSERTLDGIVKYIQEKNCKKVVVLTGAGISTAAGIPDFDMLCARYFGTKTIGIFFYDFFRDHPDGFFVVAKDLYPQNAKPTRCHYFIRLLQEKGLLLRHYTMNIDTLERRAGIPSDKLVEVHGSLDTSTCINCSAQYTLKWMEDRIFSDPDKRIPHCDKCDGLVKPDIVFSGGHDSSTENPEYCKDFEDCDLLIAMGTTLHSVPRDCPRLLINKEWDKGIHLSSYGEGDWFSFDFTNGTRDVFWRGMCDDGCEVLAAKLGWGDDLRHLIEREKLRMESCEVDTSK